MQSADVLKTMLRSILDCVGRHLNPLQGCDTLLSMSAKKPVKRPIRFDPDPLDVALIDRSPNGKGFEPEAVGLILNESFHGCALVMSGKKSELKKGQALKIKVGRLSPMMASVAWVKKIDDDLIRVGIQILE